MKHGYVNVESKVPPSFHSDMKYLNFRSSLAVIGVPNVFSLNTRTEKEPRTAYRDREVYAVSMSKDWRLAVGEAWWTKESGEG